MEIPQAGAGEKREVCLVVYTDGSVAYPKTSAPASRAIQALAQGCPSEVADDVQVVSDPEAEPTQPQSQLNGCCLCIGFLLLIIGINALVLIPIMTSGP